MVPHDESPVRSQDTGNARETLPATTADNRLHDSTKQFESNFSSAPPFDTSDAVMNAFPTLTEREDTDPHMDNRPVVS